MNVMILIPSYKPDEKVFSTIEDLRQQGFDRFLIVNDGSGPQYDAIFRQLAAQPDCEVIANAITWEKDAHSSWDSTTSYRNIRRSAA